MNKLIVLVFSVVLLGSCTKEENIPVLSTKPIVYDMTTNAESGGVITSDGGSQVTVKGVCWSNTPNPTIDNDTTINGTGVASFDSYISNLNLNTTYYVRAYATNSNGTGYGDELSFSTLDGVPVLSTKTIDNISGGPTLNILGGSAESGGVITSNGGNTIMSKGVCYSESPNPTISNSKTEDGLGSQSFTSIITGLKSNTTYYLRAYATNSMSTGYGNELNFTTGDVIGDNAYGGIIFYLDGNGGGLVAASIDQSNQAEWGCYGSSVGAGGSAIGFGLQNTMIIVNANCSPSGSGNLIAANICESLTLEGYSDWFLPSKDELNLMYQNLHLYNIGDFSFNTNQFNPYGINYWSSTVYDIHNAWYQDFEDGSQNGQNKNCNGVPMPSQGCGYVRAIRAF